MRLEGRVGTIDVDAASINPLRTSTDGSLIIREGGGRHYQAAIEGRLFSVANQAAVTTTAALATNWTGLAVCNPTGSGKNLIMLEFGWALMADCTDDGVIGLMTTTDAAMTSALTPVPVMYGRGSSVALVDTANGTTGTNVLERICGTHAMCVDETVQISVPQSIYKIDGSILLPPGRSVLTYTTTVSDTVIFHFLWEEVDA